MARVENGKMIYLCVGRLMSLLTVECWDFLIFVFRDDNRRRLNSVTITVLCQVEQFITVDEYIMWTFSLQFCVP